MNVARNVRCKLLTCYYVSRDCKIGNAFLGCATVHIAGIGTLFVETYALSCAGVMSNKCSHMIPTPGHCYLVNTLPQLISYKNIIINVFFLIMR